MAGWHRDGDASGAGDGQASLVESLLNDWPDGRIKMFITAAAIRLRRSWSQVFVDGSYVPLMASGPASDHIVAFVRQHGHRAIVTVVPRLSSTLRRRIGASGPGEEWINTTLLLPEVLADACLKNIVTGEVSRVTDRTLEASALFRSCPVALLATDMS